MEGVKGLLKKPWFWIVVAAVIGLAVLTRGRRAAPAGIPHEEPEMLRAGGDGLVGGLEQGQSALERLLERLEIGRATREEELDIEQQKTALAAERIEGSRIRFAGEYADYLRRGGAKRASKAERERFNRVKCPTGNARIDPTTGEVHCREKQGRGFFQGLSAGDILGAAQSYYAGRPRAGRRVRGTGGWVGRRTM